MLYSVRGKLIHTTSSSAVVECGGVGYNCQTTINTLKTLKLNTEVTLYTYLNVREDAVELFGFATKTELDTFKQVFVKELSALLETFGADGWAALQTMIRNTPNRLQWLLRLTTLKQSQGRRESERKLHSELCLN